MTHIPQRLCNLQYSNDGLKRPCIEFGPCSVNRLGGSDANRLGDISAFVNPVGQLLLTRRGKTIMDSVGIVFEFYTAPL